MDFLNKIENLDIVKKNPGLFEFFKFTIVGLIGTAVDFGIYAILTRVFGVYYITATAVSVFLAIINNFLSK